MKKITLLAAIFAAFSMNAQIFSEDFEGDTVDAITFLNWDSLDLDGDGQFWEVADIGAFAAVNAPNHPMQSLAADSDSWEGSAFSPDNYLVTKDPIDLTGSNGTTLTYTVGTYQTNGSFIGDIYSIYMSTSNDPADILSETPLTTRTVGDDCPSAAGDGSDSGATVTIDASAYDGQMVYLTFRHYDTTDENSVLIDDVIVDGALSVADQNFNNFNYYVAQNSELKLTASVAMNGVELYNILGQNVISQKLSSTNETVNISSLKAGVYIATVTIEGQKKSFKIVKR